MLVYLGEDQALRLRHFDEIADEPVVRGAQVRYEWGDLEKSKGAYDFSIIERDLARLQSHGKHLVIQIMDRKFGKADPKTVLPAYLLTDADYGGGAAKTNSGFVARLWDPAVMDREIALFQALGRRFDAEPFVEGITGEETAMNLGQTRPEGYTEAALAKQLGRWVTGVREAWPHTNVFLYTNFLGKELPGVVKECARSRCGVGGPDVFPANDTAGDKIVKGAAGGIDYRGRIPVAYAVQEPELGGRKGTYTPAQLFDKAYNDLHANYIFWMRNLGSGGPEQKWNTGILPFLHSIDGKIHSECPSDWHDGCVTRDDGKAR
jgi:hypothetical protein